MTTAAPATPGPGVLPPETPEELIRRFPAKYTSTVLDAIEDELSARMLQTAPVLDIFGGVGGIHKLAERLPVATCAIDIEPEQAALDPRTILGDSAQVGALMSQIGDVLAAQGAPRRPRCVITSPAYGGRLADQYLGSTEERCQPCKGRGWVLKKSSAHLKSKDADVMARIPKKDRMECGQCTGTGKSPSKRYGYAIALGRKLTPGSGAALAWGKAYKDLHRPIIQQVAEHVAPEWWMVNISSVLGTEGYMDVMEWWVEEIAKVARVEKLRAIATPRIGHGTNGERRVPAEHLIIARAA